MIFRTVQLPIGLTTPLVTQTMCLGHLSLLIFTTVLDRKWWTSPKFFSGPENKSLTHGHVFSMLVFASPILRFPANSKRIKSMSILGHHMYIAQLFQPIFVYLFSVRSDNFLPFDLQRLKVSNSNDIIVFCVDRNNCSKFHKNISNSGCSGGNLKKSGEYIQFIIIIDGQLMCDEFNYEN